MSIENFTWTARVNASYPEGITLLPGVNDRLQQELSDRASVFTKHKRLPMLCMWLSARGETAEQATEEAWAAVQNGFNTLGMPWMEVEVLSVESNGKD